MCRNVAVGIILVFTFFVVLGARQVMTGDNCRAYKLTNLYTGDRYECDTFYLHPEATVITSEFDTIVCDSILIEKLKCL